LVVRSAADAHGIVRSALVGTGSKQMDGHGTERYQAVTRRNIAGQPEWRRIPQTAREAIRVVSRVLPFRTNRYVLRELIDWDCLPDDPIFQLVFPQQGMLGSAEYEAVRSALDEEASPHTLRQLVSRIRYGLNPHPEGQLTHNVPTLDGRPLPGIQHKYQETVLFFPAQGQTCHAYCAYCFRWAQFVGMSELKFSAHETEDLIEYLRSHPQITDVLVTGGDPLVMKTGVLRRYIEPLLASELDHLRTIRIGTKAISYWPQRFVSDEDADDCLRLFEEIVESGRHLAVMGHFSHPVELEPSVARLAVKRIRSTGAEIRMQAPLVRHVNDAPEIWSGLWERGVQLGISPYYMFVQRDTGARNYFEVPLARAVDIFGRAYNRVSGLGRTVRGPVMLAFPGKVRIVGVAKLRGEKVFVLEMLQARNPAWVGRPFFAKFDPWAVWLDDLKPAFGEPRFFFDEELAAAAVSSR
jgi:KamA family protein